jgi:hypothetical protein
MRQTNLVILAAWIIHAVAWFLPTVRVQDYNMEIAGWKAFRFASCAVWPCVDVQFQTLHHAVLATISAITTVLFVSCSPWVVLRGSRRVRKASAWIAGGAFLFNTHWIAIFGDKRSELAIGYYAWWISFFLLALGLMLSVREKRTVVNQRFDETTISTASGQG